MESVRMHDCSPALPTARADRRKDDPRANKGKLQCYFTLMSHSFMPSVSSVLVLFTPYKSIQIIQVMAENVFLQLVVVILQFYHYLDMLNDSNADSHGGTGNCLLGETKTSASICETAHDNG